MKKPTVLDLFAGAGGLSLGFQMAGFDIVTHVENDKWSCETLRNNFANSTILESDIQNINPEKVKKLFGNIDVVIGGPPCQGFSIVGKSKLKSLGRHKNDSRNILYKYFVRFVKELEPRAFIMENVPGLLSHNSGETAKKIVNDFSKSGYEVFSGILHSSEYGVPQTRKRVFFVGVQPGLKFHFPNPSQKTISSKDALFDLPSLKAGKGAEILSYNKKPKSIYQKRMRKGSSGVFNHKARDYSQMDLEIFSLMKPGMKYYQIPNRLKRYRDDAFKDKYRRLFSSKPSWTIMAHLQKDGYMYIHPTQDRTITVREAARLQSFPDRFVFCGPMTQQFKQVGNAVPPLMAKAVALSLKKILNGVLN